MYSGPHLKKYCHRGPREGHHLSARLKIAIFSPISKVLADHIKCRPPHEVSIKLISIRNMDSNSRYRPCLTRKYRSVGFFRSLSTIQLPLTCSLQGFINVFFSVILYNVLRNLTKTNSFMFLYWNANVLCYFYWHHVSLTQLWLSMRLRKVFCFLFKIFSYI